MAKCIVTGGAGFIGSNLVDALIEKGFDVLVIDNLSTGKEENLKEALKNPRLHFYKVDLRNFEEVRPIFEGVDFVFHEAALPRIPLSIEKPKETNDVNIGGTLNALIASKEAGVKKFIYAASSSAYGRNVKLPMKEDMPCSPVNPYGLQKYVGELYCKVFYEIYGLPTVSLRYFNVYGPRQPKEGAYVPVIGTFLTQKKQGNSLTVTGDGSQTRDFTHVYDVRRANILAMESEKVGNGEVINIGSNHNYSINELAKLISDKITYIPLPAGEMHDTLADIGRAKKLLGWEPREKMEDFINFALETDG